MTKPIVAIVGRPNVGKSSLFNKIVKKRISIIKDIPGTTRDRIYADTEWIGKGFTLIDTGGIFISYEDVFEKGILKQAEIAMDTASVILFLTDGKEGLNPKDLEIAKLLRRAKKPVVLAVNKLDNFERELVYDFYSLGLGEPLPISAGQGKGIGDVLDAVVSHFEGTQESEAEKQKGIKIAFVGKPNVGKSSVVNRLLGFERTIVSPVSGTTRDAIDTPFCYGGQEFVLIDTAGLRRKRGVEDESIERYSILRALSAIKRADIVLNILDATETEISEQAVRIAGLVHEELKPSVLVLNKWDLVEKDGFTIEKFEDKLKANFAFMDYYRSIYISALTGKRVEKVLDLAIKVYKNASRRISTGVLNDILLDAIRMNEPPSKKGKRLKIYYATQSRTNPPKFVFFCSDESLVHFSYKRYLENCIRRAADFSGTPIEIVFSGKE